MLAYDNLEDVKAKLSGTMCFYKGKAVLVKECYGFAEAAGGGLFPKDYALALTGKKGDFAIGLVDPGGRSKKFVLLSDPDFNYMEFKLGYVNHAGNALWWYRQPIRQYKQGLKYDQLGYNSSPRTQASDIQFQFNRYVADMMENVYPKFSDAVERIQTGDYNTVAFHRDFAVSWDEVHNDIILEYKGRLVGHSQGSQGFKLRPNCEHLIEALQEAMA